MNIHLLLLNHQHQRSHIVTASTQDTFLYHRFILSVLCYSSFFHWYDGPIYIYIRCAPWIFLLTTTLHHSMMSHQYCFFLNREPCFGIFNILICLFTIFEQNSSLSKLSTFFLWSERWRINGNDLNFLRFSTIIKYLPCTSFVYCEYDQICKHANIQSVLGYSDKPFISAVKTIIDRSLYMMFTLSHAIQPLGGC